MIALFDNLGTFELILCGVAGLLVFGKRLPEVASQAGATLAKFKRSLNGAVQDSGVENELRKIKEALPTDLSMRDVARAAARKMEDRMRELGEAPALDAGGGAPKSASSAPAPSSKDALNLPNGPNDPRAAPPAAWPTPSSSLSESGASSAPSTSSASSEPSASSAPSPGTNEGPSGGSSASSPANGPATDPRASPSITPSPTNAPRASDGVDPARHFGPPGSVPRD